MPLLLNDSLSGAIAAIPTRLGRQRLLETGSMNITRFRFFDPEINYQLLNPDNIDQDDPDIIAQAVFEPTESEDNGDYSTSSEKNKGIVLDNPYFVRTQQLLVGNRLVDSPLYAQNQNLEIDISSLSGSSDFVGAFTTVTNPTTGFVASPKSFFSVTVRATDSNISALNGTVVSIYANNSLLNSVTLVDAVKTIFSNLSADQNYKVVVSNNGYSFQNTVDGNSYILFPQIESNMECAFVGTPVSYGVATYSVSGTLTNGITNANPSGVDVNIHYLSTTVSTTTNGSGQFNFAGLSAQTQYTLSINDDEWYNDNNQSLSGTVTANMVNPITVFPRSKFSGYVFYNNTTNPISNAVVNLYQGLTAGLNNVYVSSVASDQNGFFMFDHILLQNNYNINATLQGYSFVNTPLQYGASSVTASISAITIYGLKDERPVIPDTPFPRRRRGIQDKNDFPIYYDPCSWTFYSLKNAILGFSTDYQYSPIRHEQVLMSSNYLDLIQSLRGPFEFQFFSLQKSLDRFGNQVFDPYISDNYLIRVSLYAMDYQYSLQANIPQWDTTSKNDQQVVFPQQINQNATGIQFKIGDTVQFIDVAPKLDNQQLALNLNDVNNLVSLLPQQQVIQPIVVDQLNMLPNVGLYHVQGFNIDPSILNMSLTPFELAQNVDYVQYTSISGQEKQIPFEVIIDDFETVATSTIQNAISEQVFQIKGSPLPIFLPVDTFYRNGLFNNNLRFNFSFADMLTTIRSRGLVFNRVIQWQADDSSYSVGRESAHLTINTFGTVQTDDVLLFAQNGSHYTVSSEFSQFLIQYFGIPSTDQVTINKLLLSNALVDWLFYIVIVNFGAFYNAYNDGSLATLLTIDIHTRHAILLDVIQNGKSIVEVANDMLLRQQQPSTNASVVVQTLQQNISVNPAQANINGLTSKSPVASPSGNLPTGLDNVSQFQNTSGQTNQIGATTSSQFQTSPINQFSTNQLPTQISPNQVNQISTSTSTSSNQLNPTSTQVSVAANYAFVSKRLVDAITTNTINAVLKALYGLLSFDYKIAFTIVVKTIQQQVVNGTVNKPIKKATVTTKTVTPIVTRVINIQNANNYFNFNNLLEKKLKLSLAFDLTKPETQDNFIKMINYLNGRLYTIFLGVEIIDTGKITQNLNSSVKTTEIFTQSPVAVQDSICLNDKAMFMIPLTSGGIMNSSSPVVTSNPQNYNGSGIIKFAPFIDPNNPQNNVAHVVRIIKLSNVPSNQTGLVNNNVITGSDYIAFDVLQITNFSNLDWIRKVPRFGQILTNYDFNSMNADLTQLRKVLNSDYKAIPNISYVGAVGPTFGNSTNPPLFWNSSLINWVQGSTPIAMLNQILGTSKVVNVGQMVNNINEFTVGTIQA